MWHAGCILTWHHLTTLERVKPIEPTDRKVRVLILDDASQLDAVGMTPATSNREEIQRRDVARTTRDVASLRLN